MIFTKKNIVLLVLIVSTCCYVYARITLDKDILIIAKPVALLAIITYYLMKINKVNYLHFLVLLLFFTSDMLFLFQKTNGLFIGLTLYFIASSMLSVDVIGKVKTFEVRDFFKILFPITIFIFPFLYLIFKNIGIIRVVVLLFSISLILLMSSALFYYFKITTKRSIWILFGAFLFFFCNLMAALNRFVNPNLIYGAMSSLFYVVSLFCFINYMSLEKKFKH